VSRSDSGLTEFDLIGRYFERPAAAHRRDQGVLLGIGDDAALLQLPANSDLVAAVDTLVARPMRIPSVTGRWPSI
jgi:thiamine-monophosphate kinase